MSDAKTGRLDHSVRVADIACRIAAVLKDPDLNPEEVRRVGLAHDIGYLELDDHLLRKEGKLTERQFNIIKTHAECGLHLLQHVDLPEIFVHGIKHHHERLDGTGYPEGLKGRAIPKIARLLALADFFDAITSARPHRPAMTVGSGLKMMENMTNEVFDQEIYSILKGLYEEHTNGLS
jgi:putative nucleotidyltransferase with HDIG domain